MKIDIVSVKETKLNNVNVEEKAKAEFIESTVIVPELTTIAP
jgi:hypothetical protein